MKKITSDLHRKSIYASHPAQTSARTRAAAVEIVHGHRIAIDARDDERTGGIPLIGSLLSQRGLLVFFLLALLAGAAVVLLFFNFRHATIYGSTKYSQEQIESFITRGRLGDNTFVMALKYHQRPVRNIPFVDRIDIDIVNPSTVRVNVREKPLDGVVESEEGNVFLSSDGTVQTISGRSFKEVTKISGVTLADAAAGEEVMAADEENQARLDLVLDLLRAVEKYELHADAVDSDANGNITVTFGRVRIKLGKTGFDQKMHKIHQIAPYLEGRRGVISMTGYNYDGANIVLSAR